MRPATKVSLLMIISTAVTILMLLSDIRAALADDGVVGIRSVGQIIASH